MYHHIFTIFKTDISSRKNRYKRHIQLHHFIDRVRMANPGSSRDSRDPIEILGAWLQPRRNLTFDPRPGGTPDWASV